MREDLSLGLGLVFNNLTEFAVSMEHVKMCPSMPQDAALPNKNKNTSGQSIECKGGQSFILAPTVLLFGPTAVRALRSDR